MSHTLVETGNWFAVFPLLDVRLWSNCVCTESVLLVLIYLENGGSLFHWLFR